MPTVTKFLLVVGLMLAIPGARAQLTLRQSAEVEDPGTSNKPARLGYARNADSSSSALALALSYTFKPLPLGEKALIDPFVALGIEDDETINTDRKSVEFGLRATLGDSFQDANVFLFDAAIGKDRDRAAGTDGSYGRVATELVSRYLKHGIGYTAGEWALLVRPRVGLYHVRTSATDDPVVTSTGSVTGTWFQLGFDYFPPFSDRTRVTYAGKISHDARATGLRRKDTYRKHAITAEYLFYNYNKPPAAGAPRFSVLAERRIGADPLEGQPLKKQRTGLYLGVKF